MREHLWLPLALLTLSIACAPMMTPTPPPSAQAAMTTGTPTAVTGTIAYRERMALPPDAEVEVWITNTSPGIVTMALLAQAAVPTGGAQVPIPFRLAVDPARVEPSQSYGLRAVIRSQGQTLFETREPVPVLTLGAPATVTLILVRSGG